MTEPVPQEVEKEIARLYFKEGLSMWEILPRVPVSIWSIHRAVNRRGTPRPRAKVPHALRRQIVLSRILYPDLGRQEVLKYHGLDGVVTPQAITYWERVETPGLLARYPFLKRLSGRRNDE